MSPASELQKKNTKLKLKLATTSESKNDTLEPPVYVTKTSKKLAVAETQDQKEINIVAGMFQSVVQLMDLAKITMSYEEEEEEEDAESQGDDSENRDEDFEIEDWNASKQQN